MLQGLPAIARGSFVSERLAIGDNAAQDYINLTSTSYVKRYGFTVRQI